MAWGTVELEPEIRDWLEQLPTERFATAAFYIDLLAGQGPLLALARCVAEQHDTDDELDGADEQGEL